MQSVASDHRDQDFHVLDVVQVVLFPAVLLVVFPSFHRFVARLNIVIRAADPRRVGNWLDAHFVDMGLQYFELLEMRFVLELE